MAPPTPPSKHKLIGTDTVSPASARVTTYELPITDAVEGSEFIIEAVYFTNSAGEKTMVYKKTLTVDDETDGTEDATLKEYIMVNGTLTEI